MIVHSPFVFCNLCNFSYEAVLTYLYSNENEYVNVETGEAEKGAWKAVEGTEFLFFDGTPNEPLPRRETFNSHFLSPGVQIAGFALSGFALLLALLSWAWVFVFRETMIVKASQPEFLYLLCFGAALVAPSPIFVSFDEDKGVSESALTVMCQVFPWMFVIGYLIMYLSLFSKLWRLSRLLQIRRQAVQIKQVMWPFICIIAGSIAVLLVWQLYDPLKWEREVISVGDERYETYGQCASEKGMVPYLLPLAVLIFVAVGVTGWFAWKMKDVQAELSESRWIFAGIFLHIQTWLIGVPIFYITESVSRDASYLMLVVLAFSFSTSQVALVIWPKMHAWSRETFFGGVAVPKRPLINVSGGSSVRVTGVAGGGSSRRFISKNSNASTGEGNEEVSVLKKNNSALETRVRELEGLLESKSSLNTDGLHKPEQAPATPRHQPSRERMEL